MRHVTRLLLFILSVATTIGCGRSEQGPEDEAIVDDVEPIDGASPTSLTEISGLTCNLKTDLNVYATPGNARPGYLQTTTDPVFGTKVTRITGDVGASIPTIGGNWGDVVRHHYSKDQPWNADQTLIYLDTNSAGPPDLFLDGSSYQPLFTRQRPYQSDIRWHNTNADVMIYVAGNVFGYWNVRTDVKSVVRTFSGYSGFTLGGFEGNSSEDNTKVLIDGYDGSGNHVAFAYDYVSNVKYPDVSESRAGIAFSGGTISAKGQYLVVGDDDETSVVLDLQGNVVQRWPAGRPSHFDMAIDANGDDVAVGVSKDNPDAGRVIKRRLRDGQVTVLTQGGWASHSSTRNALLHGWAVSDYNQNNSAWNPYVGEVDLISLAGNTVYRLAHHHNVGEDVDYESQTHATPSRDGLRVMFDSSWGKSSFRPVSAYVVDLRSSCTYGTQPPPPPPPPTPAGTLLQNGGFEMGLNGWTSWASSRTVMSPAYAGAYALRVGLSDGGVYQDVTSKLTAGAAHQLSFVARFGGTGQYADIGIELFDAAGNVVFDRHASPSGTTWTRQTVSFTPPAGAVSALVYVWRPTGTKYLYVDDITLTR